MIWGNISLSRAGAASLFLLEALHGACFPVGWGAVEMARLLAMPGAFGLIATRRQADDTEMPVGFLLGRAAADEAEIISIGVLPEMRAHGIGGALMDEFIRQMAARGVTAIFLEVAADNAPALSLYRHQGFTMEGLRKAYYAATSADAYIMRRILN